MENEVDEFLQFVLAQLGCDGHGHNLVAVEVPLHPVLAKNIVHQVKGRTAELVGDLGQIRARHDAHTSHCAQLLEEIDHL